MANGAGGYEAFLAFMDGNGAPPAPSNGSRDGANNSTNGQQSQASHTEDGYSYEEEQERETMMRTYHHPMKQWFRDNAHLVDTYGAFPLFWQDLKNWAPYREVLKRFLRETETGNTGNGSTSASATDTSATSAATVDADGEQQPKRRKKSRWGDAVEEPASTSTPSTTTEDGDGERKRKKSRWAPAGATPTANLVTMLSQQQQQTMALRTKLDQINHRMLTVAADAARLEKDPSRSPSPPPQYDNNGKRTNTREVRMRAALEKERAQVIDQMVKINPLYRPPSDYQRSKLTRKIYIPVNDFPNYNFIGLIIGPRGNTQKRMEKESNCKIAIRGKGSVKEGSKGKKMNADENDDLHVLIMGDREEDIDKAAKEVEALLVPVDDTKNDHKQKQLRELALINGTLRDDDYCYVCGEKGHRQSECPNREKHFKAVDVRCAICGDSSHPTRDCTQRGKSAAETAEIDKEYQSFMQQLGEKPVISTASKPTAVAAPWLQPVKSSTSSNQPWLSTPAGAPGVSDVPPPPGTQSAAPALGSTPATAFPPPGSTPATAFPPPVPVAGAAYGAYGAQSQAWGQWNNGYYYGYDQSGAAPGAEAASGAQADYQQYAQYDPNAAAGYNYQYHSYQSHQPQ